MKPEGMTSRIEGRSMFVLSREFKEAVARKLDSCLKVAKELLSIYRENMCVKLSVYV